LIKRWPRDYGGRFPREPKRFPRIDRQDSFPPLYTLSIKPKEQYPDLYQELKDLQDKFIKKGRKISIHCERSSDHHISGLEICLCRCKKKCPALNFRNLVAPGEGSADYIDDFIKFQRLSNIIYGTVREKDVKLEQ
jgi:hypothetical protein